MQAKFEEKYFEVWNHQKLHYVLEDENARNMRIELIRRINSGEKLMTHQERHWSRNYSVLEQETTSYLMRSNQRVIIKSEVFGILHESHCRLGHAGRNIMNNDLQNFYGLSQSIISLYISCCEECALKRGKSKRNLVVKPILSSNFNSRCQVDLIDLQSRPDGDFKFIFVYQDHLTKYVLLRPLRTKTANEVVSNLIQIFADFGAPKILHSDNGREFANKLVIELVSAWPQCKIVHGKPRHSQSQGSVERANRDIGDMLTIYLRENRTKNWAVALPKIQVMKNARFHSGIKRSPYEALFGSKIGEQLQPDYSELECDEESDESNSSFKILDGTHWLDVDRNIGLEMDEQIASNPAEQLSSVIAEEEVLNLQHFQREIEREGARVSQQLQATQMIEKSNKRLADVDVGDSVRVSVPDVDRSKVDHRNILGIVLEVEEGFYKIGTKNGILKQSFSRNQFERCNVKFLDKSDIPNTEVALRSAVGLSSSSGSTQGLLQCNCVKCTTNKCSCKKAGRLCNSRCHSSRDCHNK